MAFLKAFLVFFFVAASSLWAAPPIDLSDFEGAARNKKSREKLLEDKDLIFTGNLGRVENHVEGLVEFTKTTLGYARPSTKAKPLLRFREEYRARFIQFSQTKKWIAVELLNGQRRAWVPVEAVKILDRDVRQDFEASQQE